MHVNCFDWEQAPVVAILGAWSTNMPANVQTRFKLYTKKYFAAIIILQDSLFSTDKDRKNAILSKYDKKSSDWFIFSQTLHRYVHP